MFFCSVYISICLAPKLLRQLRMLGAFYINKHKTNNIHAHNVL